MTNRGNNLILRVSVLAFASLGSVAGQAQAGSTQPKITGSDFPAYPLKVSANHRFLVDQNNIPFLIAGDSPQGLVSRLSEEDADYYFADRQAHGFNTLG